MSSILLPGLGDTFCDVFRKKKIFFKFTLKTWEQDLYFLSLWETVTSDSSLLVCIEKKDQSCQYFKSHFEKEPEQVANLNLSSWFPAITILYLCGCRPNHSLNSLTSETCPHLSNQKLLNVMISKLN